jgi:tetratricopeptide (TPR) repeat protein
MSGRTKARRSTTSRRFSSPRHVSLGEAPRVQRLLPLVCGACGASGRYKVGTVTLDPTIARSRDPDAIDKAAGFTEYFRCRKCGTGGPWKLPHETRAYVTALMLAAESGGRDVPLFLGFTATFDGHVMRYATEGEAHLKELIDREPERGFLWTRLGNLYSHAGDSKRARGAYDRALELDPKDIEAHSMLGQLLVEAGRPLEAVPNWHAVLKYARDARQVKRELRRELVRGAIECLLEAHARSKGKTDLLPLMDPEELEKRTKDEPLVLELHEVDLASEKGINELCDMLLQPPRRRGRGLFGHRGTRAPDAPDDWAAAPMRGEALTVGRNQPCPCGSGHKYKKCCGR